MNLCVLGAGAWGTAFALHLVRQGHTVTLVPRRFDQALALASTHENTDYLPGCPLPPSLQIGHEPVPALMAADAVLIACPSQALRDWCGRLREATDGSSPPPFLISLTKGLELGTHLRPTEVIAQMLPDCPVGVLSGPTNAGEVAQGRPAAMVLATAWTDAFVGKAQAAMSGPTLRIYTSDDLAGVEYGGCLKNIYAIAAGCCEGLRLGDNAKAALLSRALTEMVRVGQGLGARPETFYGLSGFGDLVATCYGGWSRNREFGQRIGEGRTAAKLMEGRKTVVEGYRTAESFAGLCRERGIEAPILREVHAMLYEGKKPSDAVASLMGRGLKRE